jgi:outer membrane immunogenic protein
MAIFCAIIVGRGILMKKLATAIAAIALIGTPVLAADLNKPVYKAPPPAPPAPVYTWTGWYVGGNVGFSWGSTSNDYAFAQTSTVTAGFPPFWTFNGSEREHPDGVIGGVQAGYNWQSGIYLYGIEADIQGSGEKHTGDFSGVLLNPNFGAFGTVNHPFTATETNNIDWFGTVRGRVGLNNDHWLFYATGGLAYGHVSSSGTLQPATVNPAFPNSPFLWSNSATKAGWTVGAGIESSFFGNWTWRVEYLYIDLGKIATTVAGGAGNCLGSAGPALGCNGGLGAGTLTATSHFTDNIVRVGLNYQFH